MTTLTHQDVVAASMRNALLNALPKFDFFRVDYERVDAQVLEQAYKVTDSMSVEEVQIYYTVVTTGNELAYNAKDEDFYPIDRN